MSKCDFLSNFMIMTDQHLYYNQNTLLLTVLHYYNSNRPIGRALHKEIKLVDSYIYIYTVKEKRQIKHWSHVNLCTWVHDVWLYETIFISI